MTMSPSGEGTLSMDDEHAGRINNKEAASIVVLRNDLLILVGVFYYNTERMFMLFLRGC